MSKYSKDVSGYQTIDVYDLIMLYEVDNPALQHTLKKILMAGKRGHKDFDQDIQDIIDSVQRAKALQVKKGINDLLTKAPASFDCTINENGTTYQLTKCSRIYGHAYQFVGWDGISQPHWFNIDHIQS